MMMMIHLLFLRYYKYLLQIFDVFPLLDNECLVVGSNVITLAAISDVIIVCWKYCSGGRGPGPAPVWGTHKVEVAAVLS